MEVPDTKCYSLWSSAEKKTEGADLAEPLAVAGGGAGGFAETKIGKGGDELGEDGWRSNGNVVSAEYDFYLRGEGCKALDRFCVGVEIGFRTEEPDGCGIE